MVMTPGDDPLDPGAAQELAEAGRALEAFARSGALVRSEIERLARTGEADLERLARRLAEVLAQLAAAAVVDGVAGPGPSARGVTNVFMSMTDGSGRTSPSSANQIAALAASAVRRGGRFQ
jgi:hypothetical protein